MNTSHFLKALVPLALLSVVVSCSKKSTDDTPQGMLQRTWKLAQIATDDNGNGVIDGFEIHNVAASVDDELNFKKGGTAVQTVLEQGTKVNYAFTWTLTQNTLTRIGYGHDTIIYNVANLSASQLELTTYVDSNILAAYFYLPH